MEPLEPHAQMRSILEHNLESASKAPDKLAAWLAVKTYDVSNSTLEPTSHALLSNPTDKIDFSSEETNFSDPADEPDFSSEDLNATDLFDEPDFSSEEMNLADPTDEIDFSSEAKDEPDS